MIQISLSISYFHIWILKTDLLYYISRTDLNDFHEDNIVKSLNEVGNIAILGYPGVGKSTSAKAIAAKYRRQFDKPVVVMSLGKMKTPHHKLELVQFSDNPALFPIPIVNVPFNSTDDESVLKEFVSSLNSFSKLIEKLRISQEKIDLIKDAVDSAETASKFKEILKDVLDQRLIPAEAHQVLEFVKAISDGIPYIGAALKIVENIFRYIRKKKIEKIVENEALVVIDDIADLRQNWEILSRITEHDFRYLFVIRVGPNDYVSMLKDRSYATDYLRRAGIPIQVAMRVIIPPSSHDIFVNIMKSHGIKEENIENLWTSTGGIAAAALMVAAQSANDAEMNQLLERIRTEFRNKNSEISWTAEQIEKRLAYTLFAIRIVYEDLKTKNYAYVALCCQPEGVAVDELVLFCGCEYRKIYTFNDERVADLYDRISSQTDFEQLQRIEVVRSYPTSNEKYDFVLDRNKDSEQIVDKYSEPWNVARATIQGDRIQGEAFTIARQHQGRVYYKLNNLFQHIPILLKEVEKNCEGIHNELNVARQRLLAIMKEECNAIEAITNRMTLSAYHHIMDVKDLNNVITATIFFMSYIYTKRTIHIKHSFEVWSKLKPTLRANEIGMAVILKSLSQVARDLFALDEKFGVKIADEIYSEFQVLDKSNRIISWLYCFSIMALSAYRDPNAHGLESRIEEICKSGEDPICLIARCTVLVGLVDEYFREYEFDHCISLLDKVEDAINKLQDSDLSQISRSIGFSLLVENEVISAKARVNQHRGDVFLLSNKLDHAPGYYSNASDHYKKLGLIDNMAWYSLFVGVANFLKAKNDDDSRSALMSIAEKQDIALSMLRDETKYARSPGATARRIYSYAFVAQAALDNMYMRKDLLASQSKSLKMRDEFFNPKERLGLILVPYCLRKILNGNIEMNEFTRHLLSGLTSNSELSDMIESTQVLSDLLYRGREPNSQGNDKNVTADLTEARDKMLSLLDRQNVKECRSHRINTNQGLLKESLCSMVYKVAVSTEDILARVSIHLILDNYNECKSVLFFLSHPNFPLIVRCLSTHMQNTIDKWISANSVEIKGHSNRELASSYLCLYQIMMM